MEFHAINAIYQSWSNPTIQLKLAGIRILTDEEDKAIVQDQKHYIFPMLDALASWGMRKQEGVAPSDLIALITGVGTRGKDGAYSVMGLAHIGGVCVRPLKFSVSRDVDAYWEGVPTIAHEIGHNLGADHDVNTTCGEHGYIMGYQPGTTNYWKFSTCSQDSIRSFINGVYGSCVYTTEAENPVDLGNKDPGQDSRMTMDYQCMQLARDPYVAELGIIEGFYEPKNSLPGEECQKLVCGVIYTWGDFGVYSRDRPPAEGTSCQNGGMCQKGACLPPLNTNSVTLSSMIE